MKYYSKYAQVIGVNGCMISSPGNGHSWSSDKGYITTPTGDYMSGYLSCYYHVNYNDISQTPLYAIKSGSTIGTLSNKLANNIVGTKLQLENWKYNILHCKLFIFLAMTINIDSSNAVKSYAPWLVDKVYTDDEIYSLLNITQDEQKLIDDTLRKYKRYSTWFKRFAAEII